MSSIYVMETYFIFMDLKTLLLYKVVYRLSIFLPKPLQFFFSEPKIHLKLMESQGF